MSPPSHQDTDNGEMMKALAIPAVQATGQGCSTAACRRYGEQACGPCTPSLSLLLTLVWAQTLGRLLLAGPRTRIWSQTQRGDHDLGWPPTGWATWEPIVPPS